MKCRQRKEQIIRNSVFGFLIITAAPGIMAESKPQLSGIAKDAAEELWRRGTCVLSSIVGPARRASQVPSGLTGVEVAWGRPLSMTNRITCFSKGRGYIWAATESALFGVDLAGKKPVKQYTAAHGLPDEPIDALHADGRILWIITRGGVAGVAGPTNPISHVRKDVLRLQGDDRLSPGDGCYCGLDGPQTTMPRKGKP